MLTQGVAGQPFLYESCWPFKDAAVRQTQIGQIVRLQVKKKRGKWQTPTHTPGPLTDPALLAETICPIGTLDLSAVTFWNPLKPGRYQLRHVLLSPKGSVVQIHPAVVTVEIR
jgi:hypothetical protein